MLIKITKNRERNQLTCVRKDGSVTRAYLGPTLPYHDIAHYVLENTLQLERGFYGGILSGYSIEQLSDKEVIKTLGPESLFAEIATRALQSLLSGACTRNDFIPLIETELAVLGITRKVHFSDETVDRMLSAYHLLIDQWVNIPEGGSLELMFEAV